MAEPSTYQSLYRRYRSQRFDQVLGQDHITTALRNAVRDGRVGHAYLFSGPRGTGKTSTARILAKVLNCAAPEDGEPCGKCDNCLVVERGIDIDWLLEQDAASKSKVDDMRDLLDRVPLGTSGNRKVIILDEVHMLSQGAENALLKTLEEPPAHVVFVLATTDPQKVRPTIRSRTQHFEFHLLNADVIADHVRYVIRDAALGFSEDQIDEVVDHVVQAGGGSARDTLSALDQVAALGDVVVDTQPVHAILDAVAARDTGGVLVAVADAVATGREPRTLGEALIASLRDAFLAVMGAADDRGTPAERDRAKELGAAMGPARLTRALEVLGEALTELSRKPDPRIVVEVALVRLAQPEADTSVQALAARVQELERLVQSGAGTAAMPTTPASPPAQPAASEERPVSSPTAVPDPGSDASASGASGAGAADAARAALAQQRQSQTATAATTTATATSEPAPAPASQSAEVAASSGAPGGQPTLGALAGDAGGPTDAGVTPPVEPTPSSQEPAPAPTAPVASATPAAPVAPPQDPASTSTPAPAADLPGLEQILAAWEGSLLGALPIPIRSKWRGGRWVDVAGGTAMFSVPNTWHKKACDEGRREVEQALVGHFGTAIPVEVIVEGGEYPDASGGAGGDAARASGPNSPGGGATGGSGSPSTGSAGRAPGETAPDWSGGPEASDNGTSPEAYDEAELDVTEIEQLADAHDIVTGGVELLMKEFGGELMGSEPPA